MNYFYSAIILCGGSGERLSPITPSIPKPLVPINGVSNLKRLIDICNNSEIKEVLVVVPPHLYCKYVEEIKELYYKNMKIIIVVNELAQKTNNITSFHEAINKVNPNGDGVFVIDGDTHIKEIYLPEINYPEISVFYTQKRENEWGVKYNKDDSRVTSFYKNYNGDCLMGLTYISRTNINLIKSILSEEILKLRCNDYWESFIEDNLNNLRFETSKLPDNYSSEYDTISDLIKISGLDQTLLLIPGITKIYRKLGGMTNTNYLVEYHDNKYVLRIPGVEVDNYTHHKSERKLHEILDGCNNVTITPATEFIGNLKLSKYIFYSHDWNPTKELFLLPKIINKLDLIHHIIPGIEYEILDPIIEVDNYDRLREKGKYYEQISIPPSYYNMYGEIKNILKNYSGKRCIVHGDLINSNILVFSESVYLLDFEYTGLCDFNWDYGSLLSEMSIYFPDLTKNDEDLIEMAKYISEENNKVSSYKTDVIKIMLWCGIVNYVWSSWGFARSAHGTDEFNYACLRLEQSARCIRIYKSFKEDNNEDKKER